MENIIEQRPKEIKALDPIIEKAINDAYDYIVAVTEKQGYLMDFNIIYGDGTRFTPLRRAGVYLIYNQIKAMLPEGLL